ncbi:MAG: rod shape-determining protein MreC [Prevotellaceae bacterium]|jgi:rod shape-determining protein MreC|nr:rod shape-determining protein MreC [Prevotellaceae bacterium]
MENLFRFIIKRHLVLLFIVLEGLSVFFISMSSSFRHSVIQTKVDEAKGSVMEVIKKWENYLILNSTNKKLAESNLRLLTENIDLKIQLYLAESEKSKDTALKQFDYIMANVIENTLSRSNNKLMLNVGENQGIKRDMGVISANGVVGIVDRVSTNFCTVTSLLNTSKSINGKLKTTGLYGPLVWDRKDIKFTELVDIPQHITIEKGDSVVTSGHSLTFPEGILIGNVDTFYVDKGASYRVKIKLSNDFQSLYHVYVINAGHKHELDSLKKAEIK